MNRREFFRFAGSTIIGVSLSPELLPAEPNSVESPKNSERIIRFPNYPDLNDTFGSICVYEGKYNSNDEYLTEAKGIVKIPPGKNVLLHLSRNVTSLSPLEDINPDDIQAISLQSCNSLPPEEFKKLAKLTGLKWIDFCYLKNENLSFIEYIPNLEHLMLDSSPSNKQLYPLRNLTLDRLDINYANLDDEDLKDIVGFKGGPRFLIAMWNNIKGPGYEYLNQSKRLKGLYISGNPTDDNGICHLHILNLGSLDANDTFLTDKGVECIVANHPDLENLEIGNEGTDRVKITNSSLRFVSKLLRLKFLRVSGTSITGEALKYLHPPLEALYASDTPLTDDDIGLMPESVYWAAWNGTNITDKGMPGFNKYKLKFLDVRGTDVSIEGIKSAKKAFYDNSTIFFPNHSKMGYEAPQLNFEKVLQKSDGDKTSLEELKGRIVVLESWATWCGFCKYSVAHNNQLSKQLANEPVQFIYLSDEKEDVVRNFLKENEICGWIGLNPDKSVFESYDIKGRPSTIVIDGNGKIITNIRYENLDVWRIKEAIKGNYKPLQSQQTASSDCVLEGSKILKN